MASVEFQYNGTMTVIQCQENQKMKEICNNFITKSKIKENQIYSIIFNIHFYIFITFRTYYIL